MLKGRQFDLLSSLIDWNQFEFVRTVLLLLDPVSLKSCRCVSQRWNAFIQNSIWKSRFGRAQLGKKLEHNWKCERPICEVLIEDKCEFVTDIGCDQNYVYCSQRNGTTDVFDLITACPVVTLLCNFQFKSLFKGVHFCHLYIGDRQDFLATTVINQQTTVSLWDKSTWQLTFRASDLRLKIINNSDVITKSSDGTIGFITRTGGGEWKQKKKLNYRIEQLLNGPFDVDIRADCLITMHSNPPCFKIWRLSFLETGPVGTIPYNHVGRLFQVSLPVSHVLRHPFLFLVGGSDWAGLQVWNILTRTKVRDYQLQEKKFGSITCSGTFLAIAEKWNNCEDLEVVTVLLDVNQLCDPKIENEELFEKIIRLNGCSNVKVASNKTCLIISYAQQIVINRMWDDRIS